MIEAFIITGILLLGVSAVPYLIYLCGILFGRLQPYFLPSEEHLPRITVIFSAYNEGKNIEKRLKNLKECQYKLMDLILVDDCSSDNTFNELTKWLYQLNFTYQLIRNETRKGVSASYNLAIANAKTDIVVVTDADVMFKSDALHKLIRRLISNEKIGAVTGDLQPIPLDTTTTQMESHYRSFYGRMCEWESAWDSTFNFNGALIAFRKSRVGTIPKAGADDANIAFATIRNGYRAVYEKDAVVYETVPKSFGVQYKQKIRRATGLMEAMRANDDLINTERPFSQFYLLRMWMYFVSPAIFFAGLICSFELWAVAIILAAFSPFTRSFILNQFYLLAGFFNMGKNVQTWDVQR